MNLSSTSEDLKFKKGKIEFFEDVIFGEKADVTKMSHQSLSITVSDPKKHEGGFFSKSYVTYLVKTEPFNFSVKRRYSDFEWLRSILSQFYPASFIPPVPQKNYSDRFNNDFICKRMRYLERFLRSIEANTLLASSIFLFDFLSASEEEFAVRKKEHAKLKPPVSITQMKSLDGSVLSPNIAQFAYFSRGRGRPRRGQLLSDPDRGGAHQDVRLVQSSQHRDERHIQPHAGDLRLFRAAGVHIPKDQR